MEINHIYNQDCLQGMDKMINEDMSLDLVIADPPYVISRESQFHTMQDRKNPRNGTDFGEWDKEFNNLPWLCRAYKILRKGGALLVFNDFKKATEIINIAQDLGFVYKDTIIWQKTNPMPRNRDRRYAPNVEMIIWFIKPGKWTFNRQTDTYESCVIPLPSESGATFKRYHPTQKPVKLIEHLIKVHSNEGDIVMDPFIGAGSTAIAAINTGREYIGFEIDENYYNITNKRISEI